MRSPSRSIGRGLIAAAGLVLMTGCVVPLPEHGGRGAAISRDAIEKLVPGTTSRAEVLLALGEPSGRRSDDHAFVYYWSRNVGVVGAFEFIKDLEAPRQLCLEFDNNGILSRKDFFHPGLLSLRTPPPSCPLTNQTDGEKK